MCSIVLASIMVRYRSHMYNSRFTGAYNYYNPSSRLACMTIPRYHIAMHRGMVGLSEATASETCSRTARIEGTECTTHIYTTRESM